MASNMKSEKYIKLVIYIAVVVLLNIVGYSLFFRIDLTENKIFSLSDVSKNVVSTLTEPMTITVFFSEDLPAPYNNTKRYLQDLLKEYEIHGNNYFNYSFKDISSAGEGSDESKQNKELAESYGINPVQIRIIEEDEMKSKIAYMGLVIIHGDLIEKIPSLTDVDVIEYTLTMRMQKLNHKISALLALNEKIQVELYMSSSLKDVAPYMKLNELPGIPGKIESTVQKINLKNYGRLVYKYLDPSTDNILNEMVAKHNIMALKWNAIGDKVKAGEGGIGLVLKYKTQSVDIPLMHVMRIPIFGDQYELVNMDDLEELINGGIESLIDINEKVGYLADHGTLDRMGAGAMMNQGGQSEMNSFNGLVSQNYSLKDVNLGTDGIPGDIQSLIIANPTENFTDYDLYQIDQALMSGKNIALFLDSFQETEQPNRQFGFAQGPSYQPIHTGLEKLLAHYGITMDIAYVLDENCFKQNMPERFGGGQRSIYFAPLIQSNHINNDLDFMKNIKGLISMRVSPLTLKDDVITKHEITASPLFSSSDESWTMKGNINLNPMFLQPPKDDGDKKSYTLSYLLEGSFPSYFDGKPIPEKPVDKTEDEDTGTATEEKKPDLSAFEAQGGFLARSKPAKILVVASAEMLKDSMLDQEGQSPNATFILNAIDAINGKDGIARMRSKKQSFNPLEPTEAMAKTAFKAFNIAGLPVLMALFGLLVLWKRKSRKKQIQMIFQK